MKEVRMVIKNISNRQWVNLLLELNLVSAAWKRYGPDIKIKTKDFDKIIKWGRTPHRESDDNINYDIQRRTYKRKI